MKPSAPPVLRTARLLDQSRWCIRSEHYSLRRELSHAMEPYIVRRRLCGCALTDCSGSTCDSRWAARSGRSSNG